MRSERAESGGGWSGRVRVGAPAAVGPRAALVACGPRAALVACGSGAALVALAAVGPAEASAPSTPARVTTRVADAPEWGVLFDVGVPEGATLAVAFRPERWVIGHLGFSNNLLGFGIRGGVVWLPIDSWMTPSLSLEGGYFFSGSPRSLAELFSGGESRDVPDGTSYGYGTLHAGLDFGNRRFTVFLRGGYTVLAGRVSSSLQSGSIRLETPAEVFAAFPSAKAGFSLLFW